MPGSGLTVPGKGGTIKCGQEIPAQFRATGQWLPDESIPWLLVDFQPDPEPAHRPVRLAFPE